ncbi:uncharacterized protein LOC131953447 [Physella acuta]|uniref:uncharacterized protein LOC131953447 n=1 Tax=Physella acuta TaxID=109671 RepID=UPI0027DE9CFE|nr:uncharacterized protein LOC131953447 [Physella acuta]
MTAYVFILIAGVMLQYSQAAVRIGGADAELNALCPATGYPAVSYPPSRCQPEKFVLCAQGVADYVDSCASGLLFNSLGYCDYPENVPWPNKCPKNPAGTIPTSCSDPQAKSIAKSETCKKYYACDNGKPIEMPCPL